MTARRIPTSIHVDRCEGACVAFALNQPKKRIRPAENATAGSLLGRLLWLLAVCVLLGNWQEARAASPTITTQPVSQSVNAGSKVSFSVSATGSGTLTYQWDFNGVALTDGSVVAGSHSSALTIFDAQSAYAGSYTVIVTGSGGTNTSNAATLTVNPVVPTISQQPVGIADTAGSTTILGVSVSGTEPLTYQWRLNDTPINGAVSATYSVALSSSNVGAYSVVVSNSLGSATSSAATFSLINPYVTSVWAGSSVSSGSADGTGSAARFNSPFGAVVDNSGNVYISDSGNNTIRKIAPGAIVTTFAGLAGQSGSIDGTGANARFSAPGPLAIDSSGNLYVADTGNHTIRKITPAGVVTTFAGTPNLTYPEDGPNLSAGFGSITGIAVDGNQNVYVSDSESNSIRKISAGTVSSVIGLVSGDGSYSGSFSGMEGIACDSNGAVYLFSNLTIFKISPAGIVTTLAGGNYGFADGVGSAAQLVYGQGGIAIDATGSIYLTQSTKVRRISPNGTVNTLGSLSGYNLFGVAVDSSGRVYAVDGGNNLIDLLAPPGTPVISSGPVSQTLGAGSSAVFSVNATGSPAPTFQWNLNGTPLVDGNGISGSGTATLTIANVQSMYAGFYSVTVTSGVLSVISSSATLTVTPQAPLLATQPQGFSDMAGSPWELSVTAQGSTPLSYQWALNGVNLSGQTSAILNDYGSSGVYTVTVTNAYGSVQSNPVTMTIGAGSYLSTFAGALGSSGSADGTGSAARFSSPQGIAVNSSTGDLYVADSGNSIIRKITSAGVVTTFAGFLGQAGSADGTGTAARFHNPSGLAIDGGGNIYVADSGNYTIRKITPGGVVSTIAGVPGISARLDGPIGTSEFYSPSSLVLDSAGNVLVLDGSYSNSSIRSISPNGTVTTVVGLGGDGFIDGPVATAQFQNMVGLAIDLSGNLYTTDVGRIRKISAAGMVSTLTSTPSNYNYVDGAPNLAVFYSVSSLACDSLGNIYVFDQGRLRQVSPLGTVSTLAGGNGIGDGVGQYAGLGSQGALFIDASGKLWIADTYADAIRTISVAVAPVISLQPASQTAPIGGTVTLNVVATGTPSSGSSLNYQWQFNGTNIYDYYGTYSGSNTATLKIPNIQLSYAGSYTVLISNSVGSVTSAVATVVVTSPSAINYQPYSQTVNAGNSVTFSVSASGAPSPTYQWYLGGVAISGATNSSLTLTNAQSANAGLYTVVVTNSTGTVTSNSATLTVINPPVITTQPINETISAGGTASFTVGATSNANQTYQWQVNGYNYSNSSSPTLTLTNVQAVNAGTYDVIVSNSAGQVTSTVVTLSLAAGILVQPQSQSVTPGSNVTFSVSAVGTAPTYQWNYNGVAIPGATSASFSLTDVQAATAGIYTVTVKAAGTSVNSNAAFLYVVSSKYVAVGEAGTILSSLGGAWQQSVSPVTKRLRAVASRGSNFVAVGEASTVLLSPDGLSWQQMSLGAGIQTLRGVAADANLFVAVGGDGGAAIYCSLDGQSWVGVSPGAGPFGSFAPLRAISYGDGVFVAVGVGGTVLTSPDGIAWSSRSSGTTTRLDGVQWTGTQFVAVDLNGTLYSSPNGLIWTPGSSTLSSWIEGLAVGSDRIVAVGAGGDIESTFDGATWNSQTSNTTATLHGIAWSGAVANISTGNPVAFFDDVELGIFTQPTSQTSLVGGSVTFSVQPAGNPPFSYQWSFNGAPISGAVSASLTLTNVQLANAGSYTVSLGNSTGSVTSTPALLTVNSAPVFTTQPTSKSVAVGTYVTFAVVVSGTPAPTYQWLFNGAPIAGATSASIALPNVQAGAAGTYAAVATNSLGSVTSSPALLTVTGISSVPGFSQQPVSQSIALGSSFNLTVGVTGVPTPSFQWMKDGVAIPGATGGSYGVGSATLNDAGNYTVVLTNSAGSITSNVATITVSPTGTSATQAVNGSGFGYVAGQTVTITNTIYYPGTASALSWSVLLPTGWSFASASGNVGQVGPSVGDTGTIGWAWSTVPSSPVTFTYTLNVPAGQTGTQSLTAMASAYINGVTAQAQFVAQPDPLVVPQILYHTADENHDNAISLLELTRVIELYNTHNGSTRTGAYGVLAGSEDGFTPNSAQAAGVKATLTSYHSADENQDSTLSLLELTRVIEIYNYHTGSTRTGQYHAQAGTEDGFDVGPATTP